ncbi:poly(A) polymerase 3 [Actinidia rufa]|uniref:Poly(A) polymerase 3 n=1 Tax=Actinidia rufa TaxID=165716 RepID=A0A7J0GL36_9ERIC|nr:poly(A) polymerase 3 [Actinidia rufa]
MEWIKKVACQRWLREHHITTASATVLTFGSYGLGVHNSELDIDAICIGPCFATLADFFIHCIKDAKVPLVRFKLDGISIDLPYAQLENVDVINPYFPRGIDEIKPAGEVCLEFLLTNAIFGFSQS